MSLYFDAGMNSALVLLALLLAVPLQLFLTHYINTKYGSGTPNTVESSSSEHKDIQSIRLEALNR